MTMTDGSAERELRSAMRALEQEARQLTGALYMQALKGGEYAGALAQVEKARKALAAAIPLAPEPLALDAMEKSA